MPTGPVSDQLEHLQRLHAHGVVEARVPLVVEDLAAERVQVQQPGVHALVAGLAARGERAHAGLVLQHAQQLLQLGVGLRRPSG
jgi:hypothetical protein